MVAKKLDIKKELARLEGLYQRNPALFERRRRRLIARVIANFPEEERPRAWGLQLKIDAILGHYHDPVARMNKMVELFWNQVYLFLEVLEHPEKTLADRNEIREPAKVIPFRKRPDSS